MKHYLFLLFATLIILNVNAQNELHFSHMGRENGFSLDKANAITQDKNGFIWIGTWNGLSRFDGYNCVNYLPQYHDSTSISNREIIDLLTDSSGNIWAGTSNGLNFIDIETNEIKIFPFSNRIISLYEDSERNIWIGTLGGGLHLLSKQTEKTTNFLPGETINDIHEDKHKNLWIATNYGLVLLDKENKNHKRYINESNVNSLSSSTIMQVVSSDNGYLWIGTWGGSLNRVELHNNGELKNFIQYLPKNTNSSICGDVIYKLLYDKFNNLWIASWNNGLSVLKYDQQNLSSEEATFYSYKNNPLNHNSISGNNISSLFVDRTGLLWVGASKIDRAQISENGLDRYSLPKSEDNQTLYIKCFAKFKNRLWIGANQYILEYEEINNIYVFKKKYTPVNHVRDNNLHTTCSILDICAGEGGLWVGTEGIGLIHYPFNTLTIDTIAAVQYNTKTKISTSEDRICKILPSKTMKNVLWIGTVERGFSRILLNDDNKINEIENFSTNNGLSNNSIRTIVEDKNGNLWIGTQSGLNYFDTNKKIFCNYYYSTFNKYSINDNIVNNIFEDSDNNIWIATNSGLNKKIDLDGKVAFKGYPNTDYLSNELTFSIKEDNSRNLWIRMFNGIIKFNIDSEDIKDKFFSQDFENTRLERISDAALHPNQFIIGSNGSFVTFDPDEISNKKSTPKAVITDILILNKSIKISGALTTEEIKLSHDNKMITIEFSDMNFLTSQETTYYYKLEGFDTQWNQVKGSNSATYTNIHHGEYRFFVTSGDTINHENMCKLSISISPPWWETIYAYILYLILLSGVIYFIRKYYRDKEIEKRQLSLEKMRAEELGRLNEQKSLFFTDITHELRTPLTLILEPSKELSHDNNLKSDAKEKVRLIKNSADKLMRLVNKLMEFRKLENDFSNKVVYAHVNLSQMMQEIYIFFKQLASSRKIKFSLNLESDEILIYLDIDKFEKVMFNLISNAFKYTHNGGEIIINITSESKKNARIEVIDNGIGIPKEYQEKIFERFFQINQIQTQSTGGIGLYMVKKLIDLHHGKITLYSTVGKGSSFIIELPINPENNEVHNEELKEYYLIENDSIDAYNETDVSAELEQFKMLKILIIEDDIELNRFITSELSKNFDIEKATNGKEALEILNETIPDLILSDVLMPEMGGFELAEILHKSKKLSQIPIIFLTAKTMQVDELRGLKLGAVDYISKPFDMASLKIKIKNILATRQKVKEEIRTNYILNPKQIKLPSLDENFLQNAVEAINKNIDNASYGVDDFSKDMGMSSNMLYRKIKTLTGQTAKEFIKNQRLKVAADLLLQTNRNISEIIYMVGFSTPSYFSQCFKDFYGCSPKDYIKNKGKY